MTQEQQLKQYHSTAYVDITNVAAHYALNDKRSYRGGNSGRNGNNRGGRGRGYNRGKIMCQLCGKTGHIVSMCYKRFDQQQNSPANTNNNSGGQNQHQQQQLTAFVATPNSIADSSWYFDSGATNHVTSNASNLSSKQDYHGKDKIAVGSGSKLSIKHLGSSTLQTLDNSAIVLKDILHVPAITKNLLSISKFTRDNDIVAEFYSNYCLIKDLKSKKTLLRGTLTSGLYQLDLTKADPYLLHKLSKSCNTACFSSCNPSIVAAPYVDTFDSPSATVNMNKNCITSVVALTFAVQCSSACTDLWHARLGHPSFFILKRALKFIPAPSKNSNSSIHQPKFCDSCKCGKLSQLPFPISVTKTSHPLELVFTDVWGPSPLPSTSGYRYYINFVDSYTNFTWIFPVKVKSEALNIFKLFKVSIELQFNTKLKCLQSDWGGEYRPFLPF
ncbi:hypothetical protein ACOSQ2_014783 [Xanthoceras sorbifolium]